MYTLIFKNLLSAFINCITETTWRRGTLRMIQVVSWAAKEHQPSTTLCLIFPFIESLKDRLFIEGRPCSELCLTAK